MCDLSGLEEPIYCRNIQVFDFVNAHHLAWLRRTFFSKSRIPFTPP